MSSSIFVGQVEIGGSGNQLKQIIFQKRIETWK